MKYSLTHVSENDSEAIYHEMVFNENVNQSDRSGVWREEKISENISKRAYMLTRLKGAESRLKEEENVGENSSACEEETILFKHSLKSIEGLLWERK